MSGRAAAIERKTEDIVWYARAPERIKPSMPAPTYNRTRTRGVRAHGALTATLLYAPRGVPEWRHDGFRVSRHVECATRQARAYTRRTTRAYAPEADAQKNQELELARTLFPPAN